MYRSSSSGHYGGMGYGNGGASHRKKDTRKVSVTFTRGDSTQHCSGIQSLYLHGDHLFTASRDSTAKRWFVPDGHVPRYETTYHGHTDWINDVVVVGQCLVTGSSDKTIRLWSANSQGEKMCSSQKMHSDYVSCLAGNSAKSLLASAGLRAQVFVWNLKGGTDTYEAWQLFPNDESKEKGSIYSLDMAQQADLLAAGSTDAVVRIFDLRQARKIMKLKGHTDNIRCVLLNSEGTRMLSGSTDHTVKLWDLGHQRCIQTLHCHTDSVWSLLSTDNFSTVISGGRDKCIYRTNLSQRTSELLIQEDHPVKRMVANKNGSCLWVATTSPSVRKWSLPGKIPTNATLWSSLDTSRPIPGYFTDLASKSQKGRPFLVHSTSRRASETIKAMEPLQSTPSETIQGLPPIIQVEVLNDQQHLLSKDQEGNVAKWDVSTGKMTVNFGKVDFKAALESEFQLVSIPKWFTIDNRLGMITITLSYPQCHSAEVYATNLGINASADFRLNFGDCMLRGLFWEWAVQKCAENGSNALEERSVGPDVWSKDWLNAKHEKVPCFRFWEMKPTPVWVSSASIRGDPWCLKLESISGRLQENEDLPEWVGDCVLRLRLPSLEEWKCSFTLRPGDTSQVPSLHQPKLTAPKILQIKKVAEYLQQKLDEIEPKFKVRMHQVDSKEVDEFEPLEDGAKKNAVELELLCNDKALPFSMSIGAVHDFIAKGSSELEIIYQVHSNSSKSSAGPGVSGESI